MRSTSHPTLLIVLSGLHCLWLSPWTHAEAPQPQPWWDRHFTVAEQNDPAIGGDDADPNGNGVSNLLEYLMDTDPKTAEPEAVPLASWEEGHACLTFRRLPAIQDVTVTVEESTDMDQWTPAEVAEQVLSYEAGVELVKAKRKEASPVQKFLRLKATRQTGMEVHGRTTLTDRTVLFAVPDAHFVKLSRGPITIIIADNSAIDVPELPGHRAGLNGIASLKYAGNDTNLFVPALSGMNLETIYDSTNNVIQNYYDPRDSPMELRLIDAHTVELYQPTTGVFKMESCGRYSLLPDGTIEYTFECRPRSEGTAPGYFSLFWASYMTDAFSRGFDLLGRSATVGGESIWIHHDTPEHGVNASVRPSGPLPLIEHPVGFPLNMPIALASYAHTSSWFYGVTQGYAFAKIFRAKDRIWFAQSPDGGGGCPAWDFHWFVKPWTPGKTYGLVMRIACFPYESREQVEAVTLPHRQALNP